jgi:hypothetical protein
MRLINAETERLEEFLGQDIPPYMILSHTWGEGEVLFDDLTDSAHAATKAAYPKIRETCRLAREKSLPFVWVDTCCIDKKSSAELTEAINSMYMWYQRAAVCVVYLADFPAGGSLDTNLFQCHWFTRGWTLQELIASREIAFYDQRWTQVGTKKGLADRLTQITGIDLDVIRHVQPPSAFSVAQRMSWAASRKTTRVEDEAYCLMGLFGIHMPMLYGEGRAAFRRLQEEIIRTTQDLTIFAWTDPSVRASKPEQSRIFSGVLADSAVAFSNSGSLRLLMTASARLGEASVTSRGIKLRARLAFREAQGNVSAVYLLRVCSGPSGRLGIRLKKIDENRFVRESPHKLKLYTKKWARDSTAEAKYLLSGPVAGLVDQLSDLTNQIIIQKFRPQVVQLHLDAYLRIKSVYPASRFDYEDMVFFQPSPLSSDNREGRNAVATTLGSRLLLKTASPPVDLSFTCFFIVFGWDTPSPQGTILNYGHYESALNHIISQMVEHDQRSWDVMENLLTRHIPRSSSAVFRFPKSRQTVIVSFSLERKTDRDVSPEDFWRVNFSVALEDYVEGQLYSQSQSDAWNLSKVRTRLKEPFEVAQ